MNAKISFKTATEIRVQHRNGSRQQDLAKKYNISQPAVSDIITNKVWYDPLHHVIRKHIPNHDEIRAAWQKIKAGMSMQDAADELGICKKVLERRFKILRRDSTLEPEAEDEDL